MPKMAGKLDAERFTQLDMILGFARQGRDSLRGLETAVEFAAKLGELDGSKGLKRAIETLRSHSAGAEMDWDLILRMWNSWFDRIVDAYGKPTRAARQESLRKLDEDFRVLKATAEDTASLERAILGDRRKALSERFGQLTLAVISPLAGVKLVLEIEDRATMTFELDKVACALAAYGADHGSHPAKLAELEPKLLRQLPKDIFNDSDLHYRREGKGYLLYSVGSNGRDDGGRGIEYGQRSAESLEKGWDDLVVHMPATVRPATRSGPER